MAVEVILRKPYAIGNAVVMDGKISQLFVAAMQDMPLDELRLEHSVTALPRDVIDAVFCKEQVTGDKADPAIGERVDTGDQDCAMFVMVARE
jgi:hypothetical protein